MDRVLGGCALLEEWIGVRVWISSPYARPLRTGRWLLLTHIEWDRGRIFGSGLKDPSPPGAESLRLSNLFTNAAADGFVVPIRSSTQPFPSAGWCPTLTSYWEWTIPRMLIWDIVSYYWKLYLNNMGHGVDRVSRITRDTGFWNI